MVYALKIKMITKARKFIVFLLVIFIVLVVAFCMSKKSFVSVLPIENFAQYQIICTVYDVTNVRTVELKEDIFSDVEKSIFDDIIVRGPFPTKNAVILGSEIDFFFSIRQNLEDQYVALPAIRIIQENRQFYINFCGRSYKIVSDTTELKKFLEHCLA